jgi:hypothetical protein
MIERFIKTLLYAALVVTLIGCANTSTVRSNASVFDDKTVGIAPTGQVKIEGMSNTVGSAFGALGVLIEHALTEKSRMETDARINQTLTEDSLFQMAQVEIRKNLPKFGNMKNHVLLPRTLANEDFARWFNPDSRSDVMNLSDTSADIFIDFGFQGLNITNYMAGTYAEGTFGLRVVDAKSGKVIARVRTFGVGAFGGVKLSVDRDSPDFSRESKIAFEALIKKLVLEAIDKITKHS